MELKKNTLNIISYGNAQWLEIKGSLFQNPTPTLGIAHGTQ